MIVRSATILGLLVAALAWRGGAAVVLDRSGPDADCALSMIEARCSFENAPVRIAPEGRMIAGKPHPYHPILAPLSFRDGQGTLWTAPRAALTDGASIPPALVGMIGEPTSPEFLAAAALHDVYCGVGNEHLPQFHSRGWEETHRMFHDALLAAGVSRTKARVMFAAVYLAGPRWNDPGRSLDGVPEEVLRREMERCLRFIEENDSTRDEIEDWMRGREAGLLGGTALAASAPL